MLDRKHSLWSKRTEVGCAAPVSEWPLAHDLTSEKAYSPSASPHFLLFQIPSKFCLPSEQFRCHPLHESFSESQLDIGFIPFPPLHTMQFVPWCFHPAFPYRYAVYIFLSETKLPLQQGSCDPCGMQLTCYTQSASDTCF